MEYKNLSDLIKNEKYDKAYFDSLPNSVQSRLINVGDTIHNTAELHRQARNAEERIRQNILAASKYT